MRKFLSIVRWLALVGLCTAMSPRVSAQQSVPVSWQTGLALLRPANCSAGQGWVSSDTGLAYICSGTIWVSAGSSTPPLTLNCPQATSPSCVIYNLYAPGSNYDTTQMVIGGELAALGYYVPLNFNIHDIQALDDVPLIEFSNDGAGSISCNAGFWMDGDGYLVLRAYPATPCSFAIDTNTTEFYDLMITSLNTAAADLTVGPSATKTAGAPIVKMMDTASTEFFLAPDIESVSNPPQFPVGATFSGGPVVLSHFTVSTLPSASSWGEGAMVIVTDATSFTPGTCTGGGSDTMIAVSNGTTWSCH